MAVILGQQNNQEGAAIGSAGWWANALELRIIARWAKMNALNDYYIGDHPLPFVTKAHNQKMRDQFRGLLMQSKSNFMAMVVDVCAERLRVDGFRLSASSDVTADQDTWELWQANSMDAQFTTAVTEAMVKGVSYLSVWPGDPYPVVAVEDPLQTIVAYEPGTNFTRRQAALKMWRDEWTGDMRANVYLPNGVWKFYRPAGTTTSPVIGTEADLAKQPILPWMPLDAPDAYLPNPLGVVPIIPIRNMPRLLREGESELYDVTATQDRINGTIFMRALAGYFGAHRQRWAVGLKLMVDDNGVEEEPFDAAVDRLWNAEDPDVKFGEFGQTDMSGYISAIEQDVLHIAVTTRTPRHYLIEQGQSPSGDALEAAEAGLVRKCGTRMLSFGEGAEEAMRLARFAAGNGQTPPDSEIVWADPSMRTQSQITDAVVKQYDAGLIPYDAALEALGYTQTQIARFRAGRMQDALERQILNPDLPMMYQPAQQGGSPGGGQQDDQNDGDEQSAGQ